MTYIITEPCEGTCNTASLDVWSVDCIHGLFAPTGSGKEVKTLDIFGSLMLYINPEECKRRTPHQ
ncbi:MAG: hypothetical protein GWP06_15910 [Actinobacteria bacterium]|nr:hypothetical protein [Actinomycetota bacterium]